MLRELLGVPGLRRADPFFRFLVDAGGQTAHQVLNGLADGHPAAGGRPFLFLFLGEIARAIKARRLTQEDAAALLGIDQSKVSRITRGQFRGVSEAKLLELVARLGHDVKIVVGPVRRRAGKIELQFA